MNSSINRVAISNNLQLGLTLIAVAIAIGLVANDINIHDGTGVVVSTLAAAVGWLFKNQMEERQRATSLCQAYAALIHIHLHDLKECLSESEIDRFIAIAPGIKSGAIAPTPASKVANPFDGLPDISGYLHLFSGTTVAALFRWKIRCSDLYSYLDQLGTKEWAELTPDRLQGYKNGTAIYLKEFEDFGAAAVQALSNDYPFETPKI